MYLHILNSNLFSLLYHFDFLYLSFKGLLQTFCLLLSEITLLFFQKLDSISGECSLLQLELRASSESLRDIATVTKGGGASGRVNSPGLLSVKPRLLALHELIHFFYALDAFFKFHKGCTSVRTPGVSLRLKLSQPLMLKSSHFSCNSWIYCNTSA